MQLDLYKDKFTPNLTIPFKNDSLLFGYTEETFTLEDCEKIYQAMAEALKQNQTMVDEIMKSIGVETHKLEPMPIFATQCFNRARQHLHITMQFILTNGEIISDPNGANILQRKLNGVYN